MNGLCGCGCGEKAPIAPHSRPECGWIKGEPIRFIHGHNGSRRKTPNACITDGEVAKVVIGDKVALIDSADMERVKAHRWFLSGNYARAHINRKMVYLHRFILGGDSNLVVDHINRNPLDNRRANIRLVTQALNTLNVGPRKRNITGLRGVSYHRRDGVYQGRVIVQGKSHYLGRFTTAEQASAVVQAFLSEQGIISA